MLGGALNGSPAAFAAAGAGRGGSPPAGALSSDWNGSALANGEITASTVEVNPYAAGGGNAADFEAAAPTALSALLALPAPPPNGNAGSRSCDATIRSVWFRGSCGSSKSGAGWRWLPGMPSRPSRMDGDEGLGAGTPSLTPGGRRSLPAIRSVGSWPSSASSSPPCSAGASG